MTDATARYVITAHDATKPAIDSVRRSLRDLNQQVGLSNKGFMGMLGALGRFTPVGIGITAGFMVIRKATQEYRDVIEATAKAHPELQEAMERVKNIQIAGSKSVAGLTAAYDDLAKTLQDPSYTAARTAFADWVLKVETQAKKASQAVAKLVAETRKAGVNAGIFTPRTQQEHIAANEAEIRRLEQERDRLFFGEFPIGNTKAGREQEQRLLAQIEALRRENELLQNFSTPDVEISAPNADAAEKELAGGEVQLRRLRFLTSEFRTQVSSRRRNFGGVMSIDPEQLEATRGDIAETFDFIEQDADRTLASVTEYWRDNTDQWSVFADEAARNMQSAFADFLFDPFQDGVKGMLKGFIDVVRRMVAEAASARIMESLGLGDNGGSGKSGGGFLGSFLSSLFGGHRAEGGPIERGKWYVAGEHGPEPIWGGGPGAFAMGYGGMRSGNITINNYNTFTAGSDQELRAQIPSLLRQTSDATVGRVRKLMEQGRL